MTFNRKFYLVFYLFIGLYLFSLDNSFISINKLISDHDLKVEYKEESGVLILKKGIKSVKIVLESAYIIAGNNKYFIKDFIRIENSQLLIPKYGYELIDNYFNNKELIRKKSADIRKNTGEKNYFLDVFRKNSSSATVNSKQIEPEPETEPKIKVDDEDVAVTDENTNQDEINVKDKYIYEKAPNKIKVNAIIIDPGHGGEDPGAIGLSGTKEKDIVLKVGLLLYEILKKNYPDKKIILTRDKDIFIPLDKRSSIANFIFNKYGTSLFISIHVNASRSNKSYGFETWNIIEKYKREIVKKGDFSSDVDVEKVLNSMLNNEIYNESKDLATKIQFNLNNEIGNVSEDRGIKEQTYFVIKKALMPAVLVEIGFNTNKFEETRLTKYAYLNKITTGIYYGIKDFIKEYEKTSGYTK